jgi:type VI secretion system protein VasD
LQALGDSLLVRDEFVMNPAAQLHLEYPRHQQAKHVAVMGVFRRPQEEGWRDVRTLSEGFFSRRFTSRITVHLKGNSLEIVD